MSLRRLICPLAICVLAAPIAAQTDSSLGVVVPHKAYETTVIAVPSFGKDDTAGIQWDTVAHVVRRDLQLSGYFQVHPDQAKVTRQNIIDTAKGNVDFPVWQSMGVLHYLMASVSQPDPNTLRARVILYDIPSGKAIISRNIDAPGSDVRRLAHRISDEVVRYTKFTEGIAETQFLFISEQVPGIKEVYLMDADGFNQRPVTHFNNICTTPSWGGNGTEFYYTSYKGRRANIYLQQLSGSGIHTVAAYGGTNHSPVWSDKLGRVAMVLSKDGGPEIYSAGRDGRDARRLTSTKAVEGSPCWSPDGSRIAFASNEAGNVQIFVANADGGNRRRLFSRGSWNDAPSWSPDGSRIAFVSRIQGHNDIFTINADGNEGSIARLTMNQGDNESPSWAPDSRHIAFASDRGGRWQVYIMLDDGSNQIELTSSGRNTQPAWGPLPPRN